MLLGAWWLSSTYITAAHANEPNANDGIVWIRDLRHGAVLNFGITRTVQPYGRVLSESVVQCMQEQGMLSTFIFETIEVVQDPKTGSGMLVELNSPDVQAWTHMSLLRIFVSLIRALI
jgi:hypothetical protein